MINKLSTADNLSTDTIVFVDENKKLLSSGFQHIQDVWQSILNLQNDTDDTSLSSAHDFEHKRKIHFIQIKKLENSEAFNAGGKCANISSQSDSVQIVLPNTDDSSNLLHDIILGFELGRYRFDKYRTKNKAKHQHKLSECLWVTNQDTQLLDHVHSISEGVNLCRSLVNEPGNHLTPSIFAQHIHKLTDHGIKVTILDEKEMSEHNMDALLVWVEGPLSRRTLAIMEWNGLNDTSKPLAFVGKEFALIPAVFH